MCFYPCRILVDKFHRFGVNLLRGRGEQLPHPERTHGPFRQQADDTCHLFVPPHTALTLVWGY